MSRQGQRPPRLLWPTALVALALAGVAQGQYTPSSAEPPGEPPAAAAPAPAESLVPAAEAAPPAATARPENASAPAGRELPGASEPPAGHEPPAEIDAPVSDDEARAADVASVALGNADVIDMTNAKLGDSTILAAIAANEMRFDISPRALVALKEAGVSEKVIDAMLTAETASRRAEAEAERATPVAAAATPTQPSAEFVRLSAMIERLATQQDAAAAAQRAPDSPPSADPAPRAWILSEGNRMALPPTIAQVAMTDDKTGNRLKTLQGLAGTALVFVNPAVGGIATAFGGLFRSDNQKRTAIWALAGTGATRALRAQPVFEVEFGHIPGVDPDEYQPAIVRLVPTKDNYRLVAAAKTDGAKASPMPDGPIIEEPVVTKLEQLGRGRYRAAVNGSLPAGEYALVLRPVDRDDKGRHHRRRSEASLGDLFGGVDGHILYFTWDFAVASEPAR